MMATSTRRGFIGGATALAAMCAGRGVAAGDDRPAKWWKGNLHSHTFWSDGKGFPEEAVEWYRSRGYNFLGLSDHNIFQDDPDRWVGVIPNNAKDAVPEWAKRLPHRYFFNVKQKYFDAYIKAFPDAKVRTAADGKVEARLSTFDELAARFNEDGRFLLMPDVEATRSVEFGDGRYQQLHMNYVNVPELLPSIAAPTFTRIVKSRPLAGFLYNHLQEVEALAKRHARPSLFICNHPIWSWYDVGPEVLVETPEVRFFEVCNNGGSFEAAEGLPSDGLDTDRFWDVVNAFRARRGQRLLYGIGTDDTHLWHGESGPMLMPGNAWSLVRAKSLDAASLIAAMEAGDFVTCEGLEPEDVSFDRAAGRLSVSVGASKDGAARTVKFIVSKSDFSEKPVSTIDIRPAKSKDTTRFERTVKIYDEKIGMVAKTVEGAPGEPVRAEYKMAGDDLYVRARVEERGTTLCTASLHPKGLRVAWTQPYTRG